LLVDQAKFPRDKICGDALSTEGVKFLAQMGFSERDLLSKGALMIHKERFFKNEIFINEGYIDPQITWEEHAFSIPRFNLDTMLLKKALEMDVSWYEGCKVNAISRGKIQPEIIVSGKIKTTPIRFSAPIVIVAAGAIASFYRTIDQQSSHSKSDLAFGLRQYYSQPNEDIPTFDFFQLPEIPLGYIWIFSESDRLNVGIGSRWSSNNLFKDFSTILRNFLQTNKIARARLTGAKPLESPKGAILRVNRRTNLADNGILWVGEAAGFTTSMGEGITPAMKSGFVAADIADTILKTGNFNQTILTQYTTRIFNILPHLTEHTTKQQGKD
jgi:flavin-dependent dehydrogenase